MEAVSKSRRTRPRRTRPRKDKQTTDPNGPFVYQIAVEGRLSRQWSGWFEGLTLTRGVNGETILTGLVIDQAALHGLLKKVRDLGIPLVSVNRIALEQAAVTKAKPRGEGHIGKKEKSK